MCHLARHVYLQLLPFMKSYLGPRGDIDGTRDGQAAEAHDPAERPRRQFGEKLAGGRRDVQRDAEPRPSHTGVRAEIEPEANRMNRASLFLGCQKLA